METLDHLVAAMQSLGATRMYAKRLAANDNSKNQVYLGASFEVLNLFPNLEIHESSTSKRAILKSRLNFSWLQPDGESVSPAPHAQLIFYPQYPEVRFSGFLKGCRNAPSSLMASRHTDRVLFFGIQRNGDVIGFVTSPEDPLSLEALHRFSPDPLFMNIPIQEDSRTALLQELERVHSLGWIPGKKLDSDWNPVEYQSAPNGGGYTLEAELGVKPNGKAAPDYLGWEVKQFSSSNLDNPILGGKAITLMTPEPNGGYYRDQGVESFVMNYGYPDTKGRHDRMNFGGTYYHAGSCPTNRLYAYS